MKGTLAKLNGEVVVNSVFVHPLPFNLIPHIDKFQVSGRDVITPSYLEFTFCCKDLMELR